MNPNNKDKPPGRFPAMETKSSGLEKLGRKLNKQLLGNPTAQAWILNILASLFILLLIRQPEAKLVREVYSPPAREGEPVIALRDLRIKKDLEILDQEGTERKRQEAAEKSPDYYDWDPLTLSRLKRKVSDFFQGFRELYPPLSPSPAEELEPSSGENPITVPSSFMPEKEQQLLRDFGVELSAQELDWLKEKNFSPRLEKALKTLLEETYAGKNQSPVYIVPNKELILKNRGRGIVAWSINQGAQPAPIAITNLENIVDINEAREKLKALAEEKLTDLEPEDRRLLASIAGRLLEANLTFNKNKTEDEKQKAVAAVKPLYYKFKKDEVVVRSGDRLSPEQIKKIDAILAAQKVHGPPSFKNLGLYLLVLLLNASLVSFSRRNIKKFQVSNKDLVFLAANLILFLAFLNAMDSLSGIFQENFENFPQGMNFYYLVPLAGAVMLTRMALNSEVAIVFSAAIAFYGGMAAENSILFGIYTLIGSVVAAGEVAQCRQRSTILRAGLVLGIANVLLILIISLVSRKFLNPDSFFLLNSAMLANAGLGLAGGVFMGILITGLVPVAEYAFSYTTDIKLLELLNQDHPLLKELSLNAPGTYQHSLMVANLAEAAAEAVGANPLLVRVAAMYHDIGKLKRPHYFAENQKRDNPHDTLSPYISSTVLQNHVKEGVELGKKHKLPPAVIDAIQQHHGTSLMSFFYEKAKEQSEPGSTVEETSFRYPGPKPKTRETAIVMLADVVESAARSVSDPKPEVLKGMVEKLINRFFIDGQLDECDLSLKNLHLIAKSFNKTFDAIYHPRPDYPLPAVKGAPADKKGKAEKDAAKSKDKSKTASETKSEKDKEDDKKYLKRLGM